MPRCKGLRLPKVKEHRPIYGHSCHVDTHKQIDLIMEMTGLAKWVIIDNLICTALNREPIKKIDLKKVIKASKKELEGE